MPVPPPGPASASPTASLPLHPLDYNIQVYYLDFHQAFSVLPFDQEVTSRIIKSLLADQSSLSMMVVQMFNTALNNLQYYQHVSLASLIALLRDVFSIYPFELSGLRVSEELLVVVFATLVIINYTILLNGDVYSLGISMTASIFNDFKLQENFYGLTKDPSIANLGPDAVQLHLVRLYMCLFMIDNCYSISFGRQLELSGDFELFYSNINYLVPESAKELPFFKNVQVARTMHALVKSRASSIQYPTKPAKIDIQTLSPSNGNSQSGPSCAQLFISILNDKQELYEKLKEIHGFIQSNTKRASSEGSYDDDYYYDEFYDHQLKIGRLVKKLTQSLLIC